MLCCVGIQNLCVKGKSVEFRAYFCAKNKGSQRNKYLRLYTDRLYPSYACTTAYLSFILQNLDFSTVLFILHWCLEVYAKVKCRIFLALLRTNKPAFTEDKLLRMRLDFVISVYVLYFYSVYTNMYFNRNIHSKANFYNKIESGSCRKMPKELSKSGYTKRRRFIVLSCWSLREIRHNRNKEILVN